MKALPKLSIRFVTLCLICILILGIGLWSRMTSFYHLRSDIALQSAHNFVIHQLRDHIDKQVTEQHPSLSASEQMILKQQLVEQELERKQDVIA